jgi:hypothetical protein
MSEEVLDADGVAVVGEASCAMSAYGLVRFDRM